MNSSTLAIPIGFIILSVLSCWWIISAKGAWWLKLVAIMLVPSFGILVWKAMDSYLGWPTAEALPRKAVFLGAAVREPDPRNGEPGTIYLWLHPVKEKKKVGLSSPFDYAHPPGEPRAWKIPYSREMHEGTEVGRRMVKEGRVVMFGRKGANSAGGGEGEGGDGEPGEGEEGAQGDGDAEGNPGRRGRGSGGRGMSGRQERGGQMFYELPPSQQLPKSDP